MESEMNSARSWGALGRAAQLLLTVVVATLTFGIVAQATQTITTPNAMSVSYSLATGTSSAAITPVASQPVFIMGVQTNVNYRGVCQVTLLRISGSFLEWVGLESTAGAAITQGFSAVNGTHIVYLDYSHTVDIRVASADTFRIHNGNPNTMAGIVKLIW